MICYIDGSGVEGECNGTDAICHAAVTPGICQGQASGHVCRPSTGPCDLTEVCNGTSNDDCPADAFMAVGAACTVPGDGAGSCNAAHTCVPVTDLCSGVTCSSGLVCDPTNGSCVAPTAVTCHNLRGAYASVPELCFGWHRPVAGTATTYEALTPSTRVVGPNGVCAITCTVGGVTVLPTWFSGTWLAGGTADVVRWYRTGCARLPGHPAAEAAQQGLTWDANCDLPTTVLPAQE